MNYGSFYGGRKGTSFVIVKNYPDIASMVRDFSQGGNFLDVKYDEYVLINTINKNNGDNGKIFRRGYDYNSERTISGYRVYKNDQEIIGGNAQDYEGATYTYKEDIPAGGAVYVGTIAGPAGRSPHLKILSYDDIQTIQDGFQNQKSQGNLSLVKEDLLPGKYEENDEVKYNDDILWYCASVRNQNQDDSIAYLGFKIPYPVTDFITESVSAYDSNGQAKDTSKAERVDDLSHPFYEKWKFSIPKGIKGNSLRHIYLTTFENLPNEKVFISQNNYYLYDNVLEVFEYGDEEEQSPISLNVNSIEIEISNQTYRILPNTQIIIGEEFSYDTEKNPIQPIKIHFLGILNQIVQDGFTIEDNGDINIDFTDGTSLEKKGFIKSIDDIVFYKDSEDNNKLKMQILFNTEDEQGNKEDVKYEIKFIDNISFDDNGTVTVNFTNGETYTKTNVFKNITNVYFDDNNLVFEFNNGPNIEKPISWISDMRIQESGNITVKRNGGSEWSNVPIGKIKWVENITYTQDESDDYSNKITIAYNDETSDVFENAFKSIIDVQVNSETNKLVIVYNTIDPNTNEHQTSEIDLAGGLITNVSYDYTEGEVTVEYSGGKADQTFSLDVPAKVTFANSNPARDDYKLKITSLNDAVTFLESGPIDSIYDVQITPNDHHLVVLFASAVTRNRIIDEEKNYGSEITARDGVSYSGWLDLGSITNKSGIFIGLNLDHNDFNTDISTFNNLSISQIVAKLNTDYPTGLQDIDENQGLAGKIITVGQSQSDKKFFGFNYSYDNGSYKGWYYLGSIDNVDNVISCAMGTYDQFVQEGSPAESVAEDGLYFIIQDI